MKSAAKANSCASRSSPSTRLRKRTARAMSVSGPVRLDSMDSLRINPGLLEAVRKPSLRKKPPHLPLRRNFGLVGKCFQETAQQVWRIFGRGRKAGRARGGVSPGAAFICAVAPIKSPNGKEGAIAALATEGDWSFDSPARALLEGDGGRNRATTIEKRSASCAVTIDGRPSARRARARIWSSEARFRRRPALQHSAERRAHGLRIGLFAAPSAAGRR